MPGLGLLHGVHGQEAQGVDTEFVQFGRSDGGRAMCIVMMAMTSSDRIGLTWDLGLGRVRECPWRQKFQHVRSATPIRLSANGPLINVISPREFSRRRSGLVVDASVSAR